MIILISIAAFLSTLLGGMFALRFRDKLHLVLGFSAGAIIAVAFFDLIPEALELGEGIYNTSTLMSVVALGFFSYLLLDRIIFFRAHHVHEAGSHTHEARGTMGAAALAIHSFLDGAAIGLAFQVSTEVGLIVATAVLVHDFSDGINTVGLITKAGGQMSRARYWLFIDAIAPVLGASSTLLFTVSQPVLGVILALFAGFFLYIGASDLIPESHHAHPRFLTTVMTLLGALILFVAISIAGV